jgi:predicted lipid-binding transport protein (Tim44 family)
MDEKLNEGEASPKGGLAAVGFGALAVACCAGGPLIGGLFGGIALGSVFGVGAGVLAMVLVIGLIVVRVRGQRVPLAPRVETRRDGGA